MVFDYLLILESYFLLTNFCPLFHFCLHLVLLFMNRFIKHSFFLLLSFMLFLFAESEEPKKPIRVITQGQVIVPTEKMRRIWGELISVDLETRTGSFRAESEDKVYPFAAMPYAEMLHHATKGDLSDFIIGERAIFRMHLNEAGKWYWLTYIQDEMNMLNGHKEYYFVETIDESSGRIGFTWARGDKSFIREKGLSLETNSETQYWKDGKPAKFSDIKLGDRLRAKTHGRGKGRSRICWHVFLDEMSLLKFRTRQIAVQDERLAKDGAIGYLDLIKGLEMNFTMFGSGIGLVEQLKSGMKVLVAPAGNNLKQTGESVSGTVVAVGRAGHTHTRPLTLKLDASGKGFFEKGVVRIWLAK